jgi:hypothetical protein
VTTRPTCDDVNDPPGRSAPPTSARREDSPPEGGDFCFHVV